jgi:diphosphomevalonate decarboxylase
MKATSKAPVNIAFIKYWGKKNKKLRLPANSSVSMNLNSVFTITTVEFSKKYKQDSFAFKHELATNKEKQRVFNQLDLIRKKAGIDLKARVVSENNFPKSTGLSSSASGMAALTQAGVAAAGIKLSEKNLAILARLGSGSACRSIPDGFVFWQAGSSHQSSYSFSLYQPGYWQIYDVVCLVSQEKKSVSSTKGHSLVQTSPFFQVRLKDLNIKLKKIKDNLKKKNFKGLGKLSEQEALNMHAVMMTSKPSLLYWTPNTLRLIKQIKDWRKNGLPIYFTLNTGQDVHVLVEKNNLNKLSAKLKSQKYIKKIIINKPAIGARVIKNHLF